MVKVIQTVFWTCVGVGLLFTLTYLIDPYTEFESLNFYITLPFALFNGFIIWLTSKYSKNVVQKLIFLLFHLTFILMLFSEHYRAYDNCNEWGCEGIFLYPLLLFIILLILYLLFSLKQIYLFLKKKYNARHKDPFKDSLNGSK